MKHFAPLLLLTACAAPVEETAPVVAPEPPVAQTLGATQAVTLLDRICGDGSDRFLNFGQRLAVAQQAAAGIYQQW